MYLAQMLDSSNVQTTLYVDILENVISKKEHSSKSILDEAIQEAKDVALEKKDIYSINKKHFFFVTTLLKRYYGGLINLDNRDIDEDTYTAILNVL